MQFLSSINIVEKSLNVYCYCISQGSHTPTPQVSHLTLGVYTFELTVTDKAGQSDSATVSVTVKEGTYIPYMYVSLWLGFMLGGRKVRVGVPLPGVGSRSLNYVG